MEARRRRGLWAYYRLADGRIVVNDVMFDPDLIQVLGPLLAPRRRARRYKAKAARRRPRRAAVCALHDEACGREGVVPSAVVEVYPRIHDQAWVVGIDLTGDEFLPSLTPPSRTPRTGAGEPRLDMNGPCQ